MSSTVKINVHTFNQELDFSIKSSTNGRQLLEQVAKILRIYEAWYFGLQYLDKKGKDIWIKNNKKILKQIKLKDDSISKLFFRVRYYPERIEKELIDDTTISYFYNQAKNDIRTYHVTCNLEIWIVLVSYDLYAMYGPYESVKLSDQEILDKIQLLKTHEVGMEVVAPVIISYYSQHHNLLRVEAELEYLKIMENLPGYAVKYYHVSKAKNKELLLAVQPLGIDVLKNENKFVPEFGFKWSEIGDLSCLRKKFILQTMDTKAPNFIFYTSTKRDGRLLLDDCVGTHEIYNMRRRSPTLEMKMLSKQCQDDRNNRKDEMLRLSSEIQLRKSLALENEDLKEAIVKIENDLWIYRDQVKDLSEEMEHSKHKDVDKYLNVKESLAMFEKKSRFFDAKNSEAAIDESSYENDNEIQQNGRLIKKLQSLITDLAEAKHKTEYVRSKLLQQDSLQSTLQKCKSILSMQEEQKKHKIVAFESM